MNETPEEQAARIAEWEREPSQAEIDQALFQARRPGILLNKTAFLDQPGAPGCWLGGEPTLPREIEWPCFQGHREDLTAPMHFLGQINLTHLPRLVQFPEMPKIGTLFFFWDPIFGWESTKGGRVIYIEEDVTECPSHAMPPTPVLGAEHQRYLSYAYANFPTNGYKRRNIDFLVFESFKTIPVSNGRCESAIGRATMAVEDLLFELTVDRRPNYDPSGGRVIWPHHIFASQASYEFDYGKESTDASLSELGVQIDGEPVKLLSIREDDEEIGCRFGDGTYYLSIYIGRDDLKNRNFESAFTVFERA